MACLSPRTRRLWFDVASCVDLNISTANAAWVAKRIRQIGVTRILYGSDAAAGGNLRPRESWAAFRRLPLTEAESNQIARNVAPYICVEVCWFLGLVIGVANLLLSFTPGFSPVIKDREKHENRFNGFSVPFARQLLVLS